MTEYQHIPVLLKEVLEYLQPNEGQNFVDATLGGGGYTAAIANLVAPEGKVLSIDLDGDAIKNFQFLISNFQTNPKLKKHNDKNITLHKGNFQDIDKIIEHHEFPAPDGIVADLGLSSYELEHRGISFQTNQPLDMRFDQSQDLDAKFILQSYGQKDLERIFNDYGEEKFSRQIVRKILEARIKNQPLKHTEDLYKLIEEALPKPVKHKADDSARRIFQALRIEVNHELRNLEEFLPKAFDLLKPGGRLVVVSFHSLEDRIVKQFFVGLTKGCVCPPEFPQCICGKNPKGKILTKKIVLAGEEELQKNPRAKPAKLRAIQKI
ncbi:MAG: 16S rRNA (cytosine(1402)-N(4))-methyltransferase RsmH [Candidatus Doudnabacteria bacterium]|nr:16S rRNA (cytosine(1402)-N(4))-methyltransferase RsmH [Candidatus Doudnabacteria bacterium]